MANGGSLGRTEIGAWDASRALTVAEAARLVGVSEAALRRKIQSGSLLHEVGRRAGREVQLVRLFDLADEFPDVLVPAAPDPGPPDPGPRDGGRSAPPDSGDPAREDPARARAPDELPRADPAPNADENPAEARAMRRQNHAFEVRLASLQSANDALSGHVRDLQVQRGDLRDQCNDLRVRLTSVEKERQASTAGLLMAQRRLLEIEAHPAAFVAPRPWWRRGATWAVLAVLVGLGFLAYREVHGARELEALHGLVAPALERAEADRALLAEEAERRRRSFESSLVEIREEGQSSRQALLARMQDLVEHSAALTATLAREREISRAARERLEADLAATRSEAESARLALEEERELRAASLREEARQRAELDARIAALAEEVRASGAAAALVGEQLVARDSAWNDSVARLTDELAELQAERRRAERRVQERERARLEAARWLAARWWGFSAQAAPAAVPGDEP